MTIRTQGYFVAPTSQAELPASRAAGRRAAWEEAWRQGPIASLGAMNELSQAWHQTRMDVQFRKDRWLQPAEAEDWMRQRGMEGLFEFDRPYGRQELEILESRKRAELRRASILGRQDGGGLSRFGVSLAASLVDPINVASAFVPVVAPARYGAMLRAAAGAGGRAAIRTGVGAVEGLAGGALIEPLNYAARAQEQADWRFSDSLFNVMAGGVFGAGLHVGGGALVDLVRGRNWLLHGLDEAVPAAEPGPAGARVGNLSQVRIGDAYTPVQWAVMDAAEIEPTLAKADNQYRDRNRAAAQAQVRQIAANLDFNLLGDSPLMDYGAPTLGRDLSVIGGNGRLAAIRMAYEAGRGDLYRSALIDSARRFGVSPEDIQGMVRPVLVRLLREDVDVRKAAIASNEGGSMRMSALEQAKVDAERLGSFDAFEINEDGNLSLARSRAGVRRWVEQQPATQRAALMSADGMLSAEGAARLRNAMLYRAYGDSPTLARLIEATDPGSRNVAAALVRAAPRMAELRAAAARGERFDMDISRDLQAAVERLARIRESGQVVEEALAQGGLFGADLTPEAAQILAFMGAHLRSSRALADFFLRYMDSVDALGSPKQAGLFGNAEPPSRAELLRQAGADYVPSAAELVEAAPREVQIAGMRAAIAQVVQDQPINVEPIIRQDAEGVVEAVRRADDPDGKPLNDPQASLLADEQLRDVPADTEAAELAWVEKELAEIQALRDDTIAELQQAGILQSAADLPELAPLTPAARQRYLEIRTVAEANKPAFDEAVGGIARYVGGEAVTPPLKSHAAAAEKIVTELGGEAAGIKDVLRATVMVDSIAQARDALSALQRVFEVVGKTRESLLTGKSTGNAGYRDIKVNVRIGDIVAEVQINTKANIAAKDGLDFKGGPGHKLYEETRKIARRAEAENRRLTVEEKKLMDDLNRQSRELYDAAFRESSEAADPRAAADAAANSEAVTLVPFLTTASYGKRRGGEVSNASAKYSDSSTRTGMPSTSKKAYLPTEEILAQLPEDLRAEAIAAQTMSDEADHLAEVARRASLCAIRKGA